MTDEDNIYRPNITYGDYAELINALGRYINLANPEVDNMLWNWEKQFFAGDPDYESDRKIMSEKLWRSKDA